MKKKKQKTKPAAETREKSPPAGEETLPSEETEQPSMAARPPFPEEEKSGEQAEKIQELSAEPAEEPAQANLSTGFWDSVKSFFTGGERKEDGVVESLAENERSIFWGN